VVEAGNKNDTNAVAKGKLMRGNLTEEKIQSKEEGGDGKMSVLSPCTKGHLTSIIGWS